MVSLQLDFQKALEQRECKKRRENFYNLFTLFTFVSFVCLALAYVTVFAASMASPAWRMSWPHFTYLMGLHALVLISFLLMEKTK